MSSLIEFLGSLTYIIISYANSEGLAFFLICSSLISFCYLIALPRTSSTVLNTNEANGQPCLFTDFSDVALSFSPFSFMVAIGLLFVAFIMLRYFPYIPVLYRIYVMKEW